MSTIVPSIHCRFVRRNRNRTTPLRTIKSNLVTFRRVYSFTRRGCVYLFVYSPDGKTKILKISPSINEIIAFFFLGSFLQRVSDLVNIMYLYIYIYNAIEKYRDKSGMSVDENEREFDANRVRRQRGYESNNSL